MKESGRGRRAVLFTSGGVTSVIVQKALGLSGEKTMRLNWQIRNASVSLFKYNDERLSLAGFNPVAHLSTGGRPRRSPIAEVRRSVDVFSVHDLLIPCVVLFSNGWNIDTPNIPLFPYSIITIVSEANDAFCSETSNAGAS